MIEAKNNFPEAPVPWSANTAEDAVGNGTSTRSIIWQIILTPEQSLDLLYGPDEIIVDEGDK